MKKKGALLFLSSLLLAGGLTSCGFFSENEFALESYDTSYDEKTGNTYITFYFTDEDRDPFTVTIPQGVSGKDGVSVKTATVTDNKEDHSYTITITFTDDNMEPIVLVVPYYEGVSITGVVVDKDEDDNTTLQFTYSDGTTSQVIAIPKGNGIKNITAVPTENGFHITITFTDATMEPVELDVTNGTGIKSVSVDPTKQDGSKYCLTITYTDGTSEDIYFDKPETTKWFYGTSNPNSLNTEGSKDGDFYLNYITGWVFLNNNGTWIAMFCMKADTSSEEQPCNIMFDPNGGHWEGGSTNLVLSTAVIGKTMPLVNIPIPEYEDHIFRGWFTNPTNPNSGQFTDLTIVPGNLTLLAKWESIN